MKANKRSYSPDRALYIFLAILIVGFAVRFIFTANQAHVPTGPLRKVNAKKAVIDRLCSYDHQDLPSVVWSHRAHVDNSVDGSSAAMAQLLQAGIRNFDVDVSCMLNSATGKCEFMIAHPVALAEAISKQNKEDNTFQSVTAFLDQILTFCKQSNELHTTLSTKQLHPLVTLEMKFDDPAQHLALVEVVQRSPLADRVAMIGADPQRIANILPAIKLGGIAAAYRSLPLTDHDYQWPTQPVSIGGNEAHSLAQVSKTEQGALMLELPPELVVHHEQQATTKNSALGGVATVEDATQFIHLLHPTSAAPAQSNMLQIYMPDIKLVTYPISWRQHTEKSPKQATPADTRHADRKCRTIVVAWVVDTPQQMWDAFEKGLDGVISNNPVELLEELSTAHRYHCE